MSVLVETTVGVVDLIKQYNWLCEMTGLNGFEIPEAIGLQNLLESIMETLWGTTIIYKRERVHAYLVIMPDGTTTYYMQCNIHGTFFASKEGPAEGDLTWTQLDNGDMVPVGYMQEVSIISVLPVIREKILQYISEDLGYYEQYLEPTT